MCKRLKMLFLPNFHSIKRQRIGSNSFSNTHHIRLLLPNLTIWWGNTKIVYVPTTYQISPSSCHYYASSCYLWWQLELNMNGSIVREDVGLLTIVDFGVSRFNELWACVVDLTEGLACSSFFLPNIKSKKPIRTMILDDYILSFFLSDIKINSIHHSVIESK